MRLSAWRILKTKHQDQPLSGEGARRVGGRWNHRGVPLVYLAESIALATLEVLVHLQDAETLSKYVLAEVRFDSTWVQEVRPQDLPKDWNAFPHPSSTKALGQQWIDTRSSVLLKVPSSVSPHEANYLLNPEHPDASRTEVLRTLDHAFDPRLFT